MQLIIVLRHTIAEFKNMWNKIDWETRKVLHLFFPISYEIGHQFILNITVRSPWQIKKSRHKNFGEEHLVNHDSEYLLVQNYFFDENLVRSYFTSWRLWNGHRYYQVE